MSYQPGGYPPQQPYGQPQGYPAPPVTPGPPVQPYSPAPQQWLPTQQLQPGYPVRPPRAPMSRTNKLLIGGGIALATALVVTAAAAAGADEKKNRESTAPAVIAASDTAAQAQREKPATEAEPVEDEPVDDAKAFNSPLGSTIVATSGDGDVIEATLRLVKSYAKGCNSLHVDPKNGLYVVLDVVVVQKKGTGSVNPLDFTFVADDGTSNNAMSSVFSGCDEPSLDSADLRAGQKRAGKVAFDVNSKKGTLEWAPGGLGAETVGSWKTG